MRMKLSNVSVIALRFNTWRNKNISKQVFTNVLAVVIGIGAGVVARLLKWLIGILSDFMTSDMTYGGCNLQLLLLPLAGIVLTALYMRYVLREDIEDGVDRLKTSLKAGKSRIPIRMSVAPVIANTLTLGFGGSGGSEGPTAVASAAIASNVGRCFALSREDMCMLVACGAGAGIAGIFTAPVGGIFFALECIHFPMTLSAVLGLSLSCLTAGATAFLLAGSSFDVLFPPGMIFDMTNLPVVLALGVFCGLYSRFYSATGSAARRWIRRHGRFWQRCLISGTIVSVLVFLFPTLYGEGYTSLTAIVNGMSTKIGDGSIFHGVTTDKWGLTAIVAGIVLVKGVAAYSTNSGGGVAGDFAPALFAGCMSGLLFGMLANNITGTDYPTAHLALIGMSAVLAGVVRAPLMSIFIAMETTNSFGFLVPITVATAVSYMTVHAIDLGLRHAHKSGFLKRSKN